MLYAVTYIFFRSKQVPIILQQSNGPCPIIAICNVLFLRGKLNLPNNTVEVTFQQLSLLLSAHLQTTVEELCLKNNSNNEESETRIANSIANLEATLQIIPTLENGLDLNLMFEVKQ